MSNLSKLQQDALAELARRELARRSLKHYTLYNFEGFKLNWHHEVLFEHLMKVERGEITRLMVVMPPRHSKSEVCSIQFPSWAMGRDRNKQIIEASYSSDLSADFGRQVRNLVADPSFGHIFPTVELSQDSQSKSKWNTNGKGSYNAVGIGGALTGKGADILIIDDPLKNRQDADSPVIRETLWQWYRSTARTRLSPNGAIVIVETRWHDDDLIGRILAEGTDDWTVLHFPAIAEQDEEHRRKGEALWPGQYPLENLEATKRDIGSYEWSALYQGNPINEEWQEFKPQWFQSIRWSQIAHVNTRRFATIDTALSKHKTSDFTGVTRNYVTTNNDWHFKTKRYRINSRQLIDLIFQLHDEGFEQIGVEEGAYYEAVDPFLRVEMEMRNIYPNVVPLKHGGTMKETRIRGLIPRYENHKIYHIDGECEELEEELVRFPKSRNDDCMDSAAYQSQIAFAPSEPEQAIDAFMAKATTDDRTGYLRPR
jgi:hypothetical protein